MKCKIGLKTLLGIMLGIFTTSIYSQEESHNHDQHKEVSHHHDHHKYELGIANSAVYFPKEKEFAYGLHLHLVRNIENTKLGFGLAYERIFDEHKHNTIGLVGSYNISEPLVISLTPGVTFEDNEPSDLKFAFHAEASYNFNLGEFHLGPLVEIAFDPEEYHISAGIHLAYGF